MYTYIYIHVYTHIHVQLHVHENELLFYNFILIPTSAWSVDITLCQYLISQMWLVIINWFCCHCQLIDTMLQMHI